VSRLALFPIVAEPLLQHSDVLLSEAHRELSASLGWDMLRMLRSLFQSASAARLAMDPFEKNRLLPVEVMITIAVNIAAVTAGYYVVVFWGWFGD
jgi:hypothetical protein